MRSFGYLAQLFQPEIDHTLQTILSTAPARRWTRLDDMAQNGHLGAAGVLGARALDEAANTGALGRLFGTDRQNYETAYENLSRYQTGGGQVDVSADLGRARDALPEETRQEIDGRVQEWSARHAPAPVQADNTPAQPEEVAAEPEAEAEPDHTPEPEIPAEEDVVAEAAPALEEAAPPPDHTEYEVARGDNLWKIAKEHYGLTDNKDIQAAVDKIAFENDMGEGTNANRIQPGQILRLPDDPVKGPNDPSLDWRALDAEVKAGQIFRNDFGQAATGIALPHNVPTPAFRADALAM